MPKEKHGVVTGCYQTIKPKIYSTWAMMKQRVLNKNHIAYNRYKHLKISEEWMTFKNFYEDMNEEMEKHVEEYGRKNTTLERRNNKSGYSKDNCLFVTREIQQNNMRNNVVVNGVSAKEVAKKLGVRVDNIYRHRKKGWTDDEIMANKRAFRLSKKGLAMRDRALVSIDRLEKLHKRHRAILCSHLGIGCNPTSFVATGLRFNLSAERCRQIINQSINIIK